MPIGVAVVDMEGFTRRLGQVAGRLGGQSALARAVGMSPAGINRLAHGGEPTLSTLLAIAKAGNVTVEWLATGRDEVVLAPGDVALVPRLDIAASAGAGALVESEPEREPLALSAQWLRRLGLNPATTRALEARGNSMEPTIRDGDLVLVDVAIDELAHGAVYVLTYGGALLIKRLTFNRDGSVTLSSDNRALGLADERIAPDDLPGLVVAGRVRWYGRLL